MAKSGILNTSDFEGRYLQFSWTAREPNITKNQTTIDWTLKGAGVGQAGYYVTQNIKVTIDDVTVYNFPISEGDVQLWNGTVVKTGSYTFTHNNDGTRSFKVYVEAGIYVWAVNCTGTDTFVLDTIPRRSTLTASNGTLATEQTLTINRAASTFKHRLTYECGDVVDYIAGSLTTYTTSTSIKWTPPIGLAAENTKGTSVQVVFTLYTYAEDGTHIGTTQTTIACAIPTSVKPSCTVSVEDTTGLMARYNAAVRGLSKLKVTVEAKTSQGAPISLYEISANGAKYNTNPATTEPLKTAGENKITATVKDTRGRTGSNSVTVDVLPYTSPVITMLTVHRCNADGTENDQGDYVKVIVSGAVSSLENKNTAVYTLRYRKTNGASATEIVLSDLNNVFNVNEYAYVFPADGNVSYTVAIHLEDNHNENIRTTSVSTASTLMNWGADGRSIAFGKVSEFPGFEVDMPANAESFLMVGVRNYSLGDAYGHVLYNNGLLIQWGAVSITPTQINTVASAEIIFPIPYKARPHISGTLMANTPQLVSWGVGGGSPQTDGLVIYLNRSTLHSTAFRWMAVGQVDPTRLPEVTGK